MVVCWMVGAPIAAPAVDVDHSGKALVFDYGDFVVKVKYVSDAKLAWEQIKGPTPGLKGEESYGWVEIRPHVYFIWFQERDTSVVSQVVDLERRRVHTTWISPEKKMEHFEGTVEILDSPQP